MTTEAEAVAADLDAAIDEIVKARGLPHEHVVTAMFGCVIASAIHGGVSRDEFLDLTGRLFEIFSGRPLQ